MNLTVKTAMYQFEAWTEERVASGSLSHQRYKTVRSFRRKMEVYVFCGKPLGSRQASWLTSERLELLHEELKAKHAQVTAVMIVRYLIDVLRLACRRGYLAAVPEYRPKTPAYREPKIPDRLEVERLVAALNASPFPVEHDLSVLVRFLVATGARPSEAVKLDWRQFDAKNRCFTIQGKNTKRTGKMRRIYLGSETLAMLDELGARAGRVFYRWKTSHSVKRRFEESCKRHNLPVIYPYSLRRLAITVACRKISVSDVAKLVDSSPAVIHKHYDATQAEYLKILVEKLEKENF